MTRLRRYLRLAAYHVTRGLAITLILAAAALMWVADAFDIDLGDL